MNRRELLRLLAYTGITVSNLGAMASFFNACTKRRFGRSPLRRERYGVTILVDGWRADMFDDMLNSGALPNIKKHLVERGTKVETCVSTFPSTTGPAHLPFITGVMPGYNNCPGLRWIDRSHRKLRDYCTLENVLFNNDFPRSNHTLYEILYDERTACIFDFVSRGASDILRVPAKTLWFMLTGDMEIWNKMDGYAVDAFRKVYMGDGVIPRYSFIWMPAIDHLAHFHGSMARTVTDRALDIDILVGVIMETLQKTNIYDKTLVSLVADHGLRETERHMDIRGTLAGYGLSVLDDLSSNDQFNSLYQNNAARGVSGNSFAALYFATRKKGRLGLMNYAWDRHIGYDELRDFPASEENKIDLIDLLRKENGIDLVMVKEAENIIGVFSQSGFGRIERSFTSFKYTAAGSDPLGYSDIQACVPLMNQAFHDKDEWFFATRHSDYPDGIFQIAQLFDSERCGDIVVIAGRGWDLMDQRHIASHGSMTKEEIQVPCVIAGPSVKKGTIPIARTVDLYPTYLKYLGIPHYDGEVLNVFM